LLLLRWSFIQECRSSQTTTLGGCIYLIYPRVRPPGISGFLGYLLPTTGLLRRAICLFTFKFMPITTEEWSDRVDLDGSMTYRCGWFTRQQTPISHPSTNIPGVQQLHLLKQNVAKAAYETP